MALRFQPHFGTHPKPRPPPPSQAERVGPSGRPLKLDEGWREEYLGPGVDSSQVGQHPNGFNIVNEPAIPKAEDSPMISHELLLQTRTDGKPEP